MPQSKVAILIVYIFYKWGEGRGGDPYHNFNAIQVIIIK